MVREREKDKDDAMGNKFTMRPYPDTEKSARSTLTSVTSSPTLYMNCKYSPQVGCERLTATRHLLGAAG